MDVAVTKHYTTFGLLAAGAAAAKGKRTAKLNRIGIFNSNSSSCLQFLGPPDDMKLRFSSAGCYTATATNLFLDMSAAPLPLLRSVQPFSSSLSTEAQLEVISSFLPLSSLQFILPDYFYSLGFCNS